MQETPFVTCTQPKVRFFRSGPVDGELQAGGNTEGLYKHTHGGNQLHSHQHEFMEAPGLFLERDSPTKRSDWANRAFTVGIGGPVGSGKTALILSLCRVLRDAVGLVVVTNDIFTREDWEFLTRNEALSNERLAAVETGGCPHAAIREDVSVNIESVKRLTRKFKPHIALVESGGDNLAANFSRELADYIIYVIDVAGGDKIPRKGGPGITQSDLLVINKTDLASAVGASMHVMEEQALQMRQGGPIVTGQVKHFVGVLDIARHILTAYNKQVRRGITPIDVDAICNRPIDTLEPSAQPPVPF